MRVLVTGGSGFLGSAVARHLAQAGHGVVALLRASSDAARLAGSQVEVCRFGSDQELAAALLAAAPDAIVHTACAYGRQGESLLQLADANIRFGLALLQALAQLPVTPGRRRLFLNTGTALAPEVSAYALSKHQFAQWGRRLAGERPDALQFVNVELQHMYGPGDDASKFTTHVLHACHRHQPTLALTAGEQHRDFIFIDDVLSGYETLLMQADRLGALVDVPLGSGDAPTLRSYVETVHHLCQSRTELQFGALPYRAHEAMHCQADLALMHTLGWAPRWSLVDGLQRTIQQEFLS